MVDVDCPLFAPLRPTTRAPADELRLYLEADLVDVIGKDADHAIEWWREKRSTYPQLSRMAIDYLTIPGNVVGYFVCFTSLTCCVAATSIDVEWLFSRGRLILPHTRSRLAVTSARALLCLGS